MIILLILLRLAFIGFFFASKPVDNQTPTQLFDLPKDCLKTILLFDEFCFVGPCCASSFKMFQVGYEFNKTIQINEMVEKCRATNSKTKNYFTTYLDDEERRELCGDLENWKELLKEAGELYCKYRFTNPPKGTDDLEKLERLQYYMKMHKRMLSKDKIFYEKQKFTCKKQIGLLKLCKVYLESSDAESDSTMSTIPEGSEYGSEPDLE